MDSMESYSILELNILMSPSEAVSISFSTRWYTYYTNEQDTYGKFTLKEMVSRISVLTTRNIKV